MSAELEHLTLTIRLIRSFEHRNIRFFILKNIPFNCRVDELKRTILESLNSDQNIPPPFKRYNYDSLKINSFAHGSKSNDTAITCDKDEEWILEDNKTINEYNIKNETELSFYYKEDYNKYKENPRLLW